MKYYKVIYKIGENTEYIYPPSIKEVIWTIVQYHYKDNVMIGGTDKSVEEDGVDVTELPKDEALSLIEDYKKSFPEIKEVDFPP